jgi:hypothetical protein
MWWEQVANMYIQGDDYEVHFVLDQHACLTGFL